MRTQRAAAGFSRPNTMIALMGTGKRTLMNCSAGRKATVSLQAWNIRANGVLVDIHSTEFQRTCGYVEQTDLHIGISELKRLVSSSSSIVC